jgi:hypothetical protein
LASVSGVNIIDAHQHSSIGLLVDLAISMAHWLGSPQIGQMLELIGVLIGNDPIKQWVCIQSLSGLIP